jgi:hypothetical protein
MVVHSGPEASPRLSLDSGIGPTRPYVMRRSITLSRTAAAAPQRVKLSQNNPMSWPNQICCY